jgi:3-hydroxy-9,10-secoandrosta-1,3,5(10)-triene-9,17-dione monooxygenase
MPTREEILDRARAMVPTLRKRALEADRKRGIPVETHQAFAAAGLYKLFQPARHGGYEMSLGTMVEVAGELGRGCGSSAWIFSNLAVQSWIIGMHDPAAQDDVWGPNPDALAASSFPLKGGTGRRVDGGLVLNGGWSFASGIDFADWENLQVFIPKDGGPPITASCSCRSGTSRSRTTGS